MNDRTSSCSIRDGTCTFKVADYKEKLRIIQKKIGDGKINALLRMYRLCMARLFLIAATVARNS